MAEPLAIDVAGAEAALAAAGGMPDTFTPPGQERDANGQFVANTPAPAPTPDATPAAAPESTTPPAGAQSADPAPETDFGSFTSIDVAALPPEQQQLHRALQADYTRKMQEAAPWRKLGDELGLQSPEDFRTAAEVYTRIQDPRNWPTIHGELTQYLQEYGYTPQQASDKASESLMNFAPDTPPAEPQQWNEAEVDPGVAPLMQVVQQLQQQVSQLTQQTQQEKAQQAQQAQWNAVAQKLTAAETEIRALNPHYGDDEMTSIYQLMGPDGDLKAAQSRFESMIGSQLSKYIAGKGEAITGAVPLPGGQVIPTPAEGTPLTMDAGHAAAMAHVAALERAEAAL